MPAVVSGIVGEWKQPDRNTHTIPQTTALFYWTAVTDQNDNRGFVVCNVDEKNVDLPKSFSGMSGGPFVSIDCRLLGINNSEIRRKPGTKIGEIFVLRIKDVESLFNEPQTISIDPNECTIRRLDGLVWAVSLEDKRQRVRMAVQVEFFRSISKPDAPDGRLGRIIVLGIVTSSGAVRYPMNCESIFKYEGDTDKDMLRSLNDELEFFLEDTGFELERDTMP